MLDPLIFHAMKHSSDEEDERLLELYLTCSHESLIKFDDDDDYISQFIIHGNLDSPKSDGVVFANILSIQSEDGFDIIDVIHSDRDSRLHMLHVCTARTLAGAQASALCHFCRIHDLEIIE